MEYYTEKVAELVKEYVEDNMDTYKGYSRERLAQKLHDDCWASDSVTGNASGSFFCNEAKARAFFYENHGLEIFDEMCKEFCIDAETIAENWGNHEWADVNLRCYVLGGAIQRALDELDDDGFFDDDDDESADDDEDEQD